MASSRKEEDWRTCGTEFGHFIIVEVKENKDSRDIPERFILKFRITYIQNNNQNKLIKGFITWNRIDKT